MTNNSLSQLERKIEKLLGEFNKNSTKYYVGFSGTLHHLKDPSYFPLTIYTHKKLKDEKIG